MLKRMHILWIAFFAAIIVLSLVPHLLMPPNDTDKILHVYAYCLLTLFPALALQSRRYVALVAGALFFAGIGNEVLQHFIGGRQASINDALANGAGVITGLIVAYLARRGYYADAQGTYSQRETR